MSGNTVPPMFITTGQPDTAKLMVERLMFAFACWIAQRSDPTVGVALLPLSADVVTVKVSNARAAVDVAIPANRTINDRGKNQFIACAPARVFGWSVTQDAQVRQPIPV